MELEKKKKSTNIFSMQKKSGGETETEKAQSDQRFSNEVLIGNWFENRFSFQTDKRAITPCIYGQSECIKDVTTYRHNFKVNAEKRKAIDDFVELKQQAFSTSRHLSETQIKMIDHDSLLKNMTSSKDVYYRIKPMAEKTADANTPKKKQKEDILKSYGNATKTGYRLWKYCEDLRERNTPVDVSTYKREYNAYIPLPPVDRKTRPVQDSKI